VCRSKSETYDWAVRWGHTNSSLITRRNIIDPKLMKILMCRNSASEGNSKDRFEKHLNEELYVYFVVDQSLKTFGHLGK
jgi:hypothetical protein